jgi:hypothetical protein
MAKDEARKSPAKPVADEQDTKGACKINWFLRWLRCPCQGGADSDLDKPRK